MTKIWVDAGHGGADPGAVGSGRREKDMTLQLATKYGQQMAKYDCQIDYTRTTDTYVHYNTVAARANAAQAAFFVSWHMNSFSSASATGVEVWVNTFCTNTERALAQAVCNAISNVTGLRNRGVKMRNFAVLAKTNMPAILIETGFISNPGDVATVERHMDKITSEVARVTAAEFGVAAKPQPKPPKPLDKTKPLFNKLTARVVDKDKGIIDIIAHCVRGKNRVEDVQFWLYPSKLKGIDERYTSGVQNQTDPARWARRYNLFSTYGKDKVQGDSVIVRCVVNDENGNKSDNMQFVKLQF